MVSDIFVLLYNSNKLKYEYFKNTYKKKTTPTYNIILKKQFHGLSPSVFDNP